MDGSGLTTPAPLRPPPQPPPAPYRSSALPHPAASARRGRTAVPPAVRPAELPGRCCSGPRPTRSRRPEGSPAAGPAEPPAMGGSGAWKRRTPLPPFRTVRPCRCRQPGAAAAFRPGPAHDGPRRGRPDRRRGRPRPGGHTVRHAHAWPSRDRATAWPAAAARGCPVRKDAASSGRLPQPTPAAAHGPRRMQTAGPRPAVAARQPWGNAFKPHRPRSATPRKAAYKDQGTKEGQGRCCHEISGSPHGCERLPRHPALRRAATGTQPAASPAWRRQPDARPAR